MSRFSKKTLIGSIVAVSLCLILLIVGIFAWYWDGIPWAKGAKVTTSPAEPAFTGSETVIEHVSPNLPLANRTYSVSYTAKNNGPESQTYVVALSVALTDGGLFPEANGRSLVDDVVYSTTGLNNDVTDADLSAVNSAIYYLTVPSGESVSFSITYVVVDRNRADVQSYIQGDKVAISVIARLQNA